MNPELQPPAEHPQFDSLCEGLEEYDTLPPMPASSSGARGQEQPDEQLDDQILAALVSPY